MGTAQEIETFLGKLPAPAEMIRRAELLHAIHDNMGVDSDRIDARINSRGDSRYFWEDGGGQEANIIWNPTNPEHILLLAYDHESEFNYFDQEDAYAKQLALRNLPSGLAYLGDEPALFWSWEPSKLVYAGASAWWDGTAKKWTCDAKWLAEAEKYRDDGGLAYAFGIFAVNPDVESYVKELMDQGWNDDEAGLRANVSAVLDPDMPVAPTAVKTSEPAPAFADDGSGESIVPAPTQEGFLDRLRNLFK